MKLSKREIFLLSAFLILVCAAGYYLFIFQPLNTQITELETSINKKKQDADDASLRLIQWGALTAQKNQLESDWAELEKSMPAGFDGAEFITLVKKIIFPYTPDITVKLPAQPRTQEATEVYSVGLDFSVTYDTLQSILNSFAESDAYSRVSTMSCAAIKNENDLSSSLNVSMTIELLRIQPQSETEQTED